MNTEKWDAFAEAFARGEVVPANGWEAWGEQAVHEATTIRSVLPSEVDVLVEVGCGVGRLTPYLALLFPRVIAVDTSPACRRVTADRCRNNSNVTVASGLYPAGDAALVWGNLYDHDWTAQEAAEHRHGLREIYPLVLEGNESRWMLHERTPSGVEVRTFEA